MSLQLQADGAYLRVWAATHKILLPDLSPRHPSPWDREYRGFSHTRAWVIMVKYKYNNVDPFLRGQPAGKGHWSDTKVYMQSGDR